MAFQKFDFCHFQLFRPTSALHVWPLPVYPLYQQCCRFLVILRISKTNPKNRTYLPLLRVPRLNKIPSLKNKNLKITLLLFLFSVKLKNLGERKLTFLLLSTLFSSLFFVNLFVIFIPSLINLLIFVFIGESFCP